MFNKNPFGLHIQGAAGKITFPSSGGSTEGTLDCCIDKKNLDTKNPPKSPFMVQVAIKSSIDVFYSQINCMLHCLIDVATPMNRDEFKKFWEMIPKANESVI